MGAQAFSLARFDDDGGVSFVGGWSETGRLAFPVETRLPLEGSAVLAAVCGTRAPPRIARGRELSGALRARVAGCARGPPTAAAPPRRRGGCGARGPRAGGAVP